MQILGANISLPKIAPPKITITQRDIARVLPTQTQAQLARTVQQVTGTDKIQKNVLVIGGIAVAALGLIALAVYKRKGR